MNKSSIKQLCPNMHSGGTPSTKHPEYWNGDIPWLSSSESSNDYIDNAKQFITQLGVDNSSTRFAEKNSVLIATAGEGKTRGQVSFMNISAYINQSLITMKPNENVILSRYLYYYLKNNYQRLRSLSDITGVRGSLSGELLGEFEVTYPDILIQKKIVSILSEIDEKIRINNAICSVLESMAKLLYDYWFVQFDFPDENGRPYKSSGGKMVWNEELKREIPEGWEIQRIGKLITTERGISYSTPNINSGRGVPMLNLATFRPGGGDYKADGLKHFLGDYPHNKILEPYDLIMCNTQQTAIKFETDIIGRAMLVPDIFDGDIVFSHHVNVVRTKDENLKYYLLYLFNSDYFHKYISGFTNGTNILGLSFSGVEEYLTEIPSRAILDKFGRIILETEKKKSEIITENQQLALLRDFLLPMLMNGQVKIRES